MEAGRRSGNIGRDQHALVCYVAGVRGAHLGATPPCNTTTTAIHNMNKFVHSVSRMGVCCVMWAGGWVRGRAGWHSGLITSIASVTEKSPLARGRPLQRLRPPGMALARMSTRHTHVRVGWGGVVGWGRGWRW